MYRTILGIAALLSSAAALAQSVPPPIAFAKAGAKGDAIYLVDADGGRLTKIYQGRSSSRLGAPIDSIALRLRAEDTDGGGEVAFVENDWTIKIQKHDASGQPVGNAYEVSVPAGSQCVFGDLDYLSNGTLVVSDSCGNVWSVGPGSPTGASSPVIDGTNINSLTAIGNDILYMEGNVLTRRTSAGATSTLRTLDIPYNFVDATAATAFLSDRSTFQTVDLSAPYDDLTGCTQGGMVEVSPDGEQMIYLYRGNLLLHASDCSGQTPTRVARGVRSFAWRTY
jgi:hypothetical protein